MRPAALTIAGFDPSGGAGVAADLAVFGAFGVHGAGAITAITAQDSLGVIDVWPLRPEWIEKQARAVIDDLPIRAIKVGMLGGSAQAACVAAILEGSTETPVVLDPVLCSKNGASLVDEEGIRVLKKRLLCLATLVTPNVAEAERLSGRAVTSRREMVDGARALVEELGAKAVLVKGLRDGGDVVDLFFDGTSIKESRAPEIPSADPHGTGCALSSAIAALLALGRPLDAAVDEARRALRTAIAASERVGKGAPFLRLPARLA